MCHASHHDRFSYIPHLQEYAEELALLDCRLAMGMSLPTVMGNSFPNRIIVIA